MAGASNGNGSGGMARAGNGKPPLLLIHGFTGTPVMWDPLLPYLEPHHDVEAITLPGHYGGPPLGDPGAHIVDRIVDGVERQMDALGWEQAHISGNSLGGWVSLLLAGRGRALSTIAIAPAGGWELNSAEVKRAAMLFKRQAAGMKYFYPFAQELVRRPRGRTLAMYDAMAFPARLPGHLALKWLEAAKLCPSRELLLAHSPNVNYPDSISIDSPVRIAWGTRDRILPYERYSPGWRKVLPDADWVTLDPLGHVPMSDDPARIAQTILEVSTAAEATKSA